MLQAKPVYDLWNPYWADKVGPEFIYQQKRIKTPNLTIQYGSAHTFLLSIDPMITREDPDDWALVAYTKKLDFSMRFAAPLEEKAAEEFMRFVREDILRGENTTYACVAPILGCFQYEEPQLGGLRVLDVYGPDHANWVKEELKKQEIC